MIGPDKDARNKLQLRHPATAESFVEIDYGRQSCALELYLLQLGTEQASLSAEDFEKTRIAILIAQVRKPQGSLQCLHLPVLRRCCSRIFRVAIKASSTSLKLVCMCRPRNLHSGRLDHSRSRLKE
jgi:hypothetical protein